MNKLTVLLLSLATIFLAIQCGAGNTAANNPTTSGANPWVFEGWACPPVRKNRKKTPMNSKCKKREYFYMKFPGVAKQKAIDSGRFAKKMSTCRDAAHTSAKAEAVSKKLGDYLNKATGVNDGQSTGSLIVAQTRGLIAGIGLYDCCSIDNTGTCQKAGKETWEQCICVSYMKYKGGEKAFMTRAKALSKK